MLKLVIIITFIFCCFFIEAQSSEISYYVLTDLDMIGPLYGENFVEHSMITGLLFLAPYRIEDEVMLSEILEKDELENYPLENGCEKYVFAVKDDIKWSDGEIVDAYDIEFTFNVIKNPNVLSSNSKAKTYNIEEINALDFDKLEVIFKRNYKYNLSSLTFKILPKDKLFDSSVDDPFLITEDNPFFSSNQMVCNGRYKVLSLGQTSAVLNLNQEFYDKERIPGLDYVKINRAETKAKITDLLMTGQINFYPFMSLDSKEKVEKSNNYEVIQTYDASWQFIAFNLRKPIFEDETLRKVMDRAVSTLDINNSIFQNEARLITGPFPDNSDFYNHDYQPESYSTAELIEILQSAGYYDNDGDEIREENGVELIFEMSYLKGVKNDAVFTSIRNFYKPLGIDLKSREMDYSEYVQAVSEDHDFDLAMWGYSVGSDPSIYNFFHSDEDIPGGQNIVGMNDFDEELEKIENEVNFGIKKRMANNLHIKISEYHPGIFLWRKPLLIGFNKKDLPGLDSSTIDNKDLFKYIHKW